MVAIFRCDADVVINNIFKVFDSEHTGKVVAQELLMAFSMSMKGTGISIRNFIFYLPLPKIEEVDTFGISRGIYKFFFKI